ncbi:carcinine hydrolase/isopenicillin-N N-acyltransferase family protein [Labilibaculum sp. K2S]|uniref:carcinine hydrolase/isopenicillin-N N-acyltransferase family protein n=1 Tax=Labilibaculum sp. K2S TaxID=3056386 RepID=UPI0025A4036D|nr:carcinine hydrolase/isopenicillin-N N-acyltransferase family protein [Labilibaculum sp. K2S]MDM8161089.1 carcinine hydrolase/isopenicillin-N N-acyltransferase family protein [Labilibaculum sp. K2S]
MKNLLSLLLILVVFAYQSFACTTAVISGKYTKDGRPMIWKLRDTENFENKLNYFTDGKYPYIGMINSNDEKGEQVWGGSNSKGFAIMNSASYNVNLTDTTSFKDQEGYFMKLALQTCANLEEFEQLLKDRPKPMGLAAHFGVLDAKGNAAFYEVNNQTFTKFDANDPTQAPNGYILRTNFSFTGKKDIGYGFIRFQTAQDLFYQADSCGNLNAQTIIQDFSRCLKHAVLKKDFRQEFESTPYGAHFINSDDMITRHGSSSMILIEGIKKGEASDMNTIWTQIGFPNTSIALPVWVKGGDSLPEVLTADGSGNCPLNKMALNLKHKCYPISRSAGYKYLNVSELINSEKMGIMQQLELAEIKIFKNTSDSINEWHKNQPTIKQIQEYYNWLDEYTNLTYQMLGN